MKTMRRTTTTLILGALVALLAVVPAASAATSLDSIFQDDAILLNSGSEATQTGLDEMRGLGVTTVHSLVVWAQVAPERQSLKRPSGFDPKDPEDYPLENWRKYDNLVRQATARGMSVILTPTTPTPAWAGDCTTSDRRALCVNRPSAREFGFFAAALARRYSGSFPDPENPGRTLPRVSRWSFLNEPNLGAWLTPQYSRVKGRTVATGVKIARDLLTAGLSALRSGGHASDALYIAETAPVGGTSGSLATRKNPPRTFLQGLFCLTSRGGRLIDSRIGCFRKYAQFKITGISHHPYTLGAGAPPFARAGKNDISIGFLSRLTSVLRQAAKQRRIPRAAANRIYLTEFGYQTNPPDDNFGVSWARQAEYLNLADYIGYTTKQVRGVAQYELYDDPAKASFNTGLRTCRSECDEIKKPSYAAYRTPLYVVRSGRRNVRVWGWVRPAAGRTTVEILLKTGSKTKLLKTVKTRANGVLDLRLKRASGEYQLRWSAAGERFVSRGARVALR
jgi:hypothetical protein